MKIIRNIVVLALALLSGHLSAATIAWGASPALIEVNDTFTMDIIGAGFDTNVDGGGVNISYDSSVFDILSVSIDGSVWDFGYNSTGTINNGAGTVDGIMVNAWSAVTSNFIVASIEMRAIGTGNGFLSLSEFALNPWASSGTAINPSFVTSTFSVQAAPNAVPVPAAVWLFGSGLIGLIGVARRKKA